MDRTRIVSVKLSTGETLGIEVSELSAPAEDTEKTIAALHIQFADVLKPIEGIAREIGDLLQRVSPSKAAVEFGVEVGLESGQLTALLVKGSGKANLKLTLHWDGPSPPTSPKPVGEAR